MELSTDNTLPFFGVVLRKVVRASLLQLVYVKPSNIGLLLHYNSHNNGYNQSFIAMLDQVFNLSSNSGHYFMKGVSASRPYS